LGHCTRKADRRLAAVDERIGLSSISDAPRARAQAPFQGAMHGIGLSTGTRAARCAGRCRDLH